MNFKLLTDNAETVDRSKNQTHKLIAEKLYSLISDSLIPGLTIGLEGKWGSGKSTVIKLLNEKLKQDSNTFVFYIDTWAHEGDPLRRIFLESFIEQIKQFSKFKVLSKEVKKKLDEIQSKIQYKQKRTLISKIPELDKAGKVTAGLAFLVPLGTVMMDHTYCQFTCLQKWRFYLGLLFSIAPLLACIYYAKIKQKSFFKTDKTDETIEVSNEEEKTSVDFNNLFIELQNYLVNNLNIKKTICIIDNLDRIKESDALKIWSTLQTFVQGRNSNINSLEEKLKFFVLVPYDEQGLRKLWDGDTHALVQDNKTLCSNSFFDKSFQLRIHVPQLIVNDWEWFVEEQIKIALPDATPTQKKEIIKVLESTRKSLGEAPTLREIKIYINQIGFLVSLYEGKVSLSTLCYYVVLKYLRFYDYDKIISGLINGEIPEYSMEKYSNKKTITEELCSILFMVSREEGKQLLLQKPVYQALINEPTKLEQLFDIHGDTLLTIIDFVLTNLQDIDIQIATINLYNFFKNKNNSDFSILKTFLVKESIQNKIFSNTACYSEDFWKIIVEIMNDNLSFIGKINSYFTTDAPLLINVTDNNNSYNSIKVICTVIKALCKKCSIEIDYEALSFEGLEKICSALKEEAHIVVDRIVNLATLDEDVSLKITNINYDKKVLQQIVQTLIKLGKIEYWEKTIAAIYSYLKNNSINLNNFLMELRLLNEIEKSNFNPVMIQATKALLQNGSLWNNLLSIGEAPEKYSIIYLFLKYTDNIEAFTVHPTGNAINCLNSAKALLKKQDLNAASALYAISEYTTDYQHYWKLAENTTYKLIGKIIELAIASNKKQFFSYEDPYKNLKNAVNLIGKEKIKEIVKAFIDYGNVENDLIENVYFEFLSNPDITIEIINQTKNNEVIKSLADEVLDTDENDWFVIFTSNHNVLNVLLCLAKANKHFKLNEPFYKAFEKYVIDNISKVNIEDEKLVILFDLIGKSWKKNFSIQMEKKLLEQKFVVPTPIQQFCLKVIKLEYLITERKIDFSDLLKSYIESRNEAILRFVIALINNSEEKYIPEAHYSDILKSSVEKISDDKLKEDISQIFNIKSVEG